MISKTLGTLLTNLCVLSLMPDEKRLGEHLYELFRSLPGIDSLGLILYEPAIRLGNPCFDCHNGSPSHCQRCRFHDDPQYSIYTLEIPENYFGTVVLKISDQDLFQSYEPHLSNIFILISMQLENFRYRNDIKASEERFKALFELAPVAYFLNDSEGAFIDGNRACEVLTGYKREELIGKNFIELKLLSPSEIQKTAFTLKPNPMGKPTGPDELILNHRNGQEVLVEMRSFPVTINGEGLVLSMANDITERRQAEEERLRLLASLQQSEKIESIGTLAGGIAHDFNNILGIILGNAELAMDDIPEWNPARHNLDEARRACLRAKEVVGQILSFSRKSVVEQKPINLVPVVKESLKFLRASIPASVDIRENFSNDIDNILGDSAQIQQIVINLCTNASHAMENEGGILEIALENTEIDEDTVSRHSDLNPGSYVHLRVTDTGDGINPEVIARIFDPYFTTKDVGKGTGLGLSVVHGIVNSHNGRITVESKTGKGTTFNILFPAVEKQIPEKPKKLDELPTGNETILFVDDEESMVNLNQQRLERLGYKVTGKTDPSEALEFFRSDPNQFDLVITDMTMPRMTGDKLTQEILKIRPDMPIILCTGYSNRISEERAQKLGIRKYIEKPIEMETLAKSVREVLDRK